MRRISKRAIANELGYTPQWVARQLNGFTPPSDRFRQGVSGILDLPEAVLFRNGAGGRW